MQNLVFFMDPTEAASNIALKAGNMYLNRFCIDETAAFDLSGVYHLQKSSHNPYRDEAKIKGKEYSFFLYFNSCVLFFYICTITDASFFFFNRQTNVFE